MNNDNELKITITTDGKKARPIITDEIKEGVRKLLHWMQREIAEALRKEKTDE